MARLVGRKPPLLTNNDVADIIEDDDDLLAEDRATPRIFIQTLYTEVVREELPVERLQSNGLELPWLQNMFCVSDCDLQVHELGTDEDPLQAIKLPSVGRCIILTRPRLQGHNDVEIFGAPILCLACDKWLRLAMAETFRTGNLRPSCYS